MSIVGACCGHYAGQLRIIINKGNAATAPSQISLAHFSFCRTSSASLEPQQSLAEMRMVSADGVANLLDIILSSKLQLKIGNSLTIVK